MENEFKILLYRVGVSLYLIYDWKINKIKKERERAQAIEQWSISPRSINVPFSADIFCLSYNQLKVQVMAALFIFNSILFIIEKGLEGTLKNT